MNSLMAGFARLDVTAMLGIPIRGYNQVYLVDGALDPLGAKDLLEKMHESI